MNLLKHTLLLLCLALCLSATPARSASPAEAEVKKTVETFYQQYYHDFIHRKPKGDWDSKLIQWVKDSPYTSASFKKGLAKAMRDAKKANPEVGLDADPILAGQDYPEKGYRAKTIKITGDHAAVTMEGIDSQDFHIPLTLVHDHGQWLIERIRNIP